MKNDNNPSSLSKEQIQSVMSLYLDGNINQAIDRIKALNNEYPNVPILFNILGACYKAIGEIDGAIQMFDTATQIKSDYSEAYFNIGVIYQELQQFEKSISNYNKAIEINNKYPDAHNNLGIVYLDTNIVDKAIIHFESAVKYKPDFAEAHNNLGSALQEKGELKSALTSYKKAISINSDYAQAHNNIGILLQKNGDLGSARLSYESAIKINPSYASAHHNLSSIKIYSKNDEQIIQMESILASNRVIDSDRIKLGFALSKAYEELGDKEKLFKYLNEANRLRKVELNFSFDIKDEFNLIIEKIFNKPFNVSKKLLKNKNLNPIFILGMPRSGTSLVEQIISGHPKVYGGGELNYMPRIISPLLERISLNKNEINENLFVSIRQQYLNKVSNLNISEKFLTDKWPLNFRNIGFILTAFPEAKIIHLKRDKMAVCWSIYKHYFSQTANGWAYNFEDIVKFYQLYETLMDFWHMKFPNRIYDLSYEDLTLNQEKVTNDLLFYCELKWHKNCLNFEDNVRAVNTASSAQVRNKMYKGSSEVWKKYEEYLSPLVSKLSENK
jgi:tetratricopeptide (TPR) repeat protein